MELKVEIGYKELWELIKQLPPDQLTKLRDELRLEEREKKSFKAPTKFQEFLKEGPIMTEDQYQHYLTHRKSFNRWGKN